MTTHNHTCSSAGRGGRDLAHAIWAGLRSEYVSRYTFLSALWSILAIALTISVWILFAGLAVLVPATVGGLAIAIFATVYAAYSARKSFGRYIAPMITDMLEEGKRSIALDIQIGGLYHKEWSKGFVIGFPLVVNTLQVSILSAYGPRWNEVAHATHD